MNQAHICLCPNHAIPSHVLNMKQSVNVLSKPYRTGLKICIPFDANPKEETSTDY